MTDREPLTLDQFREMLDGFTTTIVCHPDLEEQVRDTLIETPIPHGLWRVRPDPTCPEGKLFLVRPPKPFEWSP